MLLSTIIICTIAAFVAGFIDAIAGGGGLITMPAMLLTGVPAHIALGSGKLGSCVGSAVALVNFARSGLVLWRVALVGIGFALVGASLGSYLTLYFDSETMGKILVGLLPVGMLVTLMPKKEKSTTVPELKGTRFWLLVPLVCTVVGVYDGFFGPGAGTFFIIAFHLFLGIPLLHSSGTAKVLNFATNLGSLLAFIWYGKVVYALGLPMAVGSIGGNWLGSRMAIKIGNTLVRRFLTISMALLFATLVYQYFFK
ncbi:MAG: TSUP family transporter [Desulfovibrionaceae bacterium]|jgi:uncharacterized protein|nr:TSUP family transporter [Desulfovibrionaceae bacterium]